MTQVFIRLGDQLGRLYRLLKRVIFELFTYMYSKFGGLTFTNFLVMPVCSFIANKINYEYSFTSSPYKIKSRNSISVLESVFFCILSIFIIMYELVYYLSSLENFLTLVLHIITVISVPYVYTK